MMAALFDRPAFRTPFQQESSLPAFQRAIEDTIAALNTGVWRTREGDEIRRIPSIHHLRDAKIKASVSRAAQSVDRLRRTFVAGLRDGRIRPCSCDQQDCPVFFWIARLRASLIKSEAARSTHSGRPTVNSM
jgi:hypothetical protein